MSQRSKRHRSVKPPEGSKEQSFFQTKADDSVDNYEKESGSKPKDIQRLSTPKEDEEPGGSGTNEERMKNDKNIQE